MTARQSQIRLAIALSCVIFALNAWICHELFTADFVNNLLSNEGAFAALGRFFREHPFDHRWFPWFNTGMPMEYAYQPVLPVLAAVTGGVTGWSAARALHFVVAFAYCCGPVTLFWLAMEWSESVALSLSAALAYSLTSPAELLIPELRFGSAQHWGPMRLNNLVWWGEAPHNVALTMLPLALLFLYRSIVRGGAGNYVLAAVACGALAITNAFGALGIALGALAMVLALGRGVRPVLVVGACSYAWISPWLPPSLIGVIRRSAWSAAGFFQANTLAYIAIPAAILAFALVWFVTRWLSSFERFAILFGVWMCAIPLGYFWLHHLTIVPQASRYQLELEMAVCLLFGCAVGRIWSGAGKGTGGNASFTPWRVALIAIAVIVTYRQAAIARHLAKTIVRPIDITKTIEYKTATWINSNMPNERVFPAGDTQFIFNLFSDNPQFSSGHEPTAPNWMQRAAVFTVVTGESAGNQDAADSIFWLKAYGNQAIAVPGPSSREHYHPIVNPHKFDGVLPVLWHEEDDTIFRVPQRSASMAHVIPRAAVVMRRPIHGLDLDPARAYVAALDDASLPLANLTWTTPSRAAIETRMNRNQVISVQETWMPGWRAEANGREVKVHGDQLGLIVIEPECTGSCEVNLIFGVTTEGWICRILSVFATFFGAGSLILSRRSGPVAGDARATV